MYSFNKLSMPFKDREDSNQPALSHRLCRSYKLDRENLQYLKKLAQVQLCNPGVSSISVPFVFRIGN